MKKKLRMPHLRGHEIAAVDVETTGVDSNFHEVVQIGLVLLDQDLNPTEKRFYHNIRPDYPGRIDPGAVAINQLTMDILDEAPSQLQVADWLLEWYEGLNLGMGAKLIPLAHNWTFEYRFLSAWLGSKLRDEIFHFHPRDAMVYALGINDRYGLCGAVPFEKVSLAYLCDFFGIVNEKPHDALADAIAEAKVYKALLGCERGK
jgi:DNA polymerase III epsilon subunit-like protein